MIILRELQLNNFISHEDTNIKFGPEDRVLIDGKSGSGKSSIVEALIWALYGSGRVDNKSLIRKGAKEASVTVTLLDEENSYVITRKITAGGKHTIMALQDGQPVLTAGTKETQKWIEHDLLHCSYELFINSVAYPQGNQESFVLASSVRRKELLLEIIGVEDIDAYYEKTRGLLSTKEVEHATTKGELDALRLRSGEVAVRVSKLEERQKAVEEAEKDAKATEELKDANYIAYNDAVKAKGDLDELQLEQTMNTAKGVDLASAIAALNGEIERGQHHRPLEAVKKEIEELLPKEEEYQRLTEKLNEAVQKNHERNALLAEKPDARDYDREIASLQARLKRLTDETPACPAGEECPFAKRVAPEKMAIEEEIDALKKKSEEHDTAMADWTDRLGSLGDDPTPQISGELAALRPAMEKLKNLRTELSTADTRAAAVAEKTKERDAKTAELNALVERGTIVDTKIKELKDRKVVEKVNLAKEAYTRSVDAERQARSAVILARTALTDSTNAVEEHENILKRISELESDKTLETQISHLKLLKEALGSTGIKALAVDYMIPRLEDKINEVLEQMSDFRVQLDTQKKSQSDTTIEGLFITIRNDRGEEFDFASYSGGEKLKITVAISEALASLQKIGFRILDELFVGLDEDSTESFAHVLSQVQSRFSQMLCISHLRGIKDLFETRVTLVKLDGKSTIA